MNNFCCVLALMGLVLSGCSPSSSFMDEYDKEWSRHVIHDGTFPYGDIFKIEVYSDNSNNGIAKPYSILSTNAALWETSNPIEIGLFVKELRTTQPRPPGTSSAGQNITLHIILKRKEGAMGYGRCLWKSNIPTPCGFIKSIGGAKAYRYTETLLPWLKERSKTKG